MTDRAAQLDRLVQIQGTGRHSESLYVEPGRRLVAVAAEQGADVLLEVFGPRGELLGHADSPIRRTGLQRVVLGPAAGGKYSIALSAKEEVVQRAQVRLRILNFPAVTPATDACLDRQRQLGVVESAYADGLAASTGAAARSSASTANATERFAMAAKGYEALAIVLAHSRDSPLLLAQVEHALSALLYQNLQDWTRARDWANKASGDFEAAGDRYGEARTRAMTAAAMMEIADPQAQQSATTTLAKARRILTEVAAFHESRGESFDQALALNNIGLAWWYEGENQAAARAFQSALALYKYLHERARKGQVLNNLGLVHYELGRFPEAGALFMESLSLVYESSAPELHASVLGNLALTQLELGQHDLALRNLELTLQKWRALQNRRQQADNLQRIGEVYGELGDHDSALSYYRQALELSSAELDPRGRTAALRAIASIVRERGDYAGALTLHQQAESLATSHSVRARLELQRAIDLDGLGRNSEALATIDAVLANPANSRLDRARALLQRGICRGNQRAFAGAIRDLRTALTDLGSLEAITDQFGGWLALARVQRRAGDATGALAAVDRALALSEELRVQSSNPEMRATRLQPLRPAFDLKVALLAEQAQRPAANAGAAAREHAIRGALATAENARARALVDFQNFDASLSASSAQLLQDRQGVVRDLAINRYQLEQLRSAGVPETQRLRDLRVDIANARRRLGEIDAQIGRASDAPAAISLQAHVDPRIDLATVPAGAALVEYWLGAEHALAWVVTRERVSMLDLGSSAPLAQAARAYHESLQHMASVAMSERLQRSDRVYDLAVRPLREYLRGKRQLVFAADGELHYVSFAALRTGTAPHSRFLVEDFDISSTPSIALFLNASSRKPVNTPANAMLLVDDPVYEAGDARLAAAGQPQPSPALLRNRADPPGLRRLPGSAREATAIVGSLGTAQVDRLEGLGATRERFLAAPLERYRYIHIASHGLVDVEIPLLSSLVLSTRDAHGQSINGRVLAADFMTRKLSADMVVLSACDTALGRNIAGEGLIGLRYVMIARGARAVVASLWPVPDQIGTRLMSGLYAREQQRAAVDAALSGAMRQMLAEGIDDPALWGSFAVTVR